MIRGFWRDDVLVLAPPIPCENCGLTAELRPETSGPCTDPRPTGRPLLECVACADVRFHQSELVLLSPLVK